MQQLHPKAVWLFFIQFLFLLLTPFFFIFFVFGSRYSVVLSATKGVGFSWGWLIFGIIVYILFCYLWARLSYRFWRYEISENAIKIEKGVIWKKYVSIPYERIQNVDIYRGLLARILSLSDLHIQTAGYSGYGRHGMGTEGRFPGLDPQTAERLREELIKRAKGTKQGL